MTAAQNGTTAGMSRASIAISRISLRGTSPFQAKLVGQRAHRGGEVDVALGQAPGVVARGGHGDLTPAQHDIEVVVRLVGRRRDARDEGGRGGEVGRRERGAQRLQQDAPVPLVDRGRDVGVPQEGGVSHAVHPATARSALQRRLGLGVGALR